jgi:hypothetical protein
MLTVNMNNLEVNKKLNNVVRYSNGFLDGVEMNKIIFMNMLGEYVVDMLGKYIDTQARGNRAALHHVYEWGATGSQGARLFKMNSAATKSVISITGSFLPSSSISDNATEPFVDKANIMENAIGITIEPRNSSVLAFEADGETVFTMNSVYVANPGGDAVAGSFGKTVESFFDVYFTRMIMQPFLMDLATADEYVKYFPAGATSGYSVGVKAGKEYLNSVGVVIE